MMRLSSQDKFLDIYQYSIDCKMSQAPIYKLRNKASGQVCDIVVSASSIQSGNLPAIDFKHISEIRLNRIVGTKYESAHFQCVIIAGKQKLILSAEIDDAYASDQFRLCMLELHQNLAKANRTVVYKSGMASQTGFYLLSAFFILLFAALEIAVVFGVQRKGNYVVGGIVLLGIPIIAFLFLRWAIRLTKPQIYSPLDIPESLLPVASSTVKRID